jgi:hypothetical protein
MVSEYEHFQDICLTSLSSHKAIRFAGVIDQSGRLLVGKYREDIDRPLIDSSVLRTPNADSFHISFQAVELNRKFEKHLGDLSFQIASFGKVILITIPLTNKKDRYLCISIDAKGAPYQAIVKKILDNNGY